MKLSRFVAIAATLSLLASPAFAQPAPPRARPALNNANALNASSSRSPIGFVPPSPDNIRDYVKAVGAVEVAASFHSTKDTKAGPITVRNGADVSMNASFSKKNGEETATLDGLTLTAKGVDVGPKLGPLGIQFQRAQINADGSMAVKLNSWIPELKIDRVERQPNGDVKLKGAWWMPDCTITKDGDVLVGKTVTIFGKEIGGMKKVGHVDPRLFVHWPPRLEDIAFMATHPDPNSTLIEDLKKLGKVSAGGLAWDVKAKAEDLPVTFNGQQVKSREAIELHGNALLENGQLTTTGDRNTAKVQIDIEKQTLGDGNTGGTVAASATLDGAYRLTVPLEDGQNVNVAFDGKAAVSAQGENIRVTLPSGAKVALGAANVSITDGLHFAMDGPNKSFKLDDAHYTFDAKGPIHVEKLGPISTLDLDGELRSSGMTKLGPNGLLALNGNAKGSVEIRNAGLLPLLVGDKGFYAKTVKPGARVDVDLDQIAAAIRLPANGTPASFEGADARGRIGVHGDLGDVGFKKDGINVTAPTVHADIVADGNVRLRGTDVSGSGNVTGGVSLPNGGTVAVNNGKIKATTSIDRGSHIDVNANVTKTPGASASADTVVTTANLNARSAPNTTNSRVLRVIPKGTTLTIAERQGDWAKILAADGTPYYVNMRFVSAPSNAGGNTVVEGRLTGDLGATNATVDAFGAKGDVKAHVSAGIDAPFRATIGSDGKPKIDTKATRATLPIRIDLKKGTKISFGGQTVTLTDDACYVQLTGDIALDGNGKPVLKKLSNVVVELKLGGLNASLFGGFNVPNLATTRFKGDVTFGSSGMQIHGNASVVLGGQTAPLINISF